MPSTDLEGVPPGSDLMLARDWRARGYFVEDRPGLIAESAAMSGRPSTKAKYGMVSSYYVLESYWRRSALWCLFIIVMKRAHMIRMFIMEIGYADVYYGNRIRGCVLV